MCPASMVTLWDALSVADQRQVKGREVEGHAALRCSVHGRAAGHVYIWEKATGRLFAWLNGDK